jgi:MYXO-CTERM domain-containing protein
MDFIERIFGIAPDGGSGTFEFLLFAVPLAGLAILWGLRRRARARTRSKSKR